MNSDFNAAHFLAPKYWPTWIGLFFIWLLSRLPFVWQLKFGAALGTLLYYAIPSRRRVCLINLGIAFPDKTEAERQQLCQQVYHNIGYTISEMASLWFGSIHSFSERFTIEGLDNLTTHTDSGRGVILLQAHFSTLEFCGAWLATKIKVFTVYDNPKNPLYAALLRNRRERYIKQTIDNRDIRSMIKNLKKGEIVWYSPDQSTKKSDGAIETFFFNHPVLTTPGTSRMARMTGAAIIPYLAVRTKPLGHYKLIIYPALEDIPTKNAIADTQAVNHLFESHIKQYPEQYFWVHKRFKRPSEQHPDPYHD